MEVLSITASSRPHLTYEHSFQTMELKQRFVVAHPRQLVWAFFGRMEQVTPCMPGASLTEPPSGTQAKFKLNIKLGPIGAAFVGTADVERNDDNHRGTIRGNARDSRGDSRVSGVVDYSLTPGDDGRSTVVDIDVDFTLTGRLAQFSRAGIVNDLAGRLTADFARNLEAALNVESPVKETDTLAAPDKAATVGANTSSARRPTPPAPAQLNAGTLLLAVLWGRIKALVGSLFGHR